MCGKNQTASKKPLTERNAVDSQLGLHIFNLAQGIHKANNANQTNLFE